MSWQANLSWGVGGGMTIEQFGNHYVAKESGAVF